MSSVTGCTVINLIKAEVARLLTEAGAPPKVLTAACHLGADRAGELFEATYDDYRRRVGVLYKVSSPQSTPENTETFREEKRGQEQILKREVERNSISCFLLQCLRVIPRALRMTASIEFTPRWLGLGIAEADGGIGTGPRRAGR